MELSTEISEDNLGQLQKFYEHFGKNLKLLIVHRKKLTDFLRYHLSQSFQDEGELKDILLY